MYVLLAFIPVAILLVGVGLVGLIHWADMTNV